jgi:hypothetical protein
MQASVPPQQPQQIQLTFQPPAARHAVHAAVDQSLLAPTAAAIMHQQPQQQHPSYPLGGRVPIHPATDLDAQRSHLQEAITRRQPARPPSVPAIPRPTEMHLQPMPPAQPPRCLPAVLGPASATHPLVHVLQRYIDLHPIPPPPSLQIASALPKPFVPLPCQSELPPGNVAGESGSPAPACPPLDLPGVPEPAGSPITDPSSHSTHPVVSEQVPGVDFREQTRQHGGLTNVPRSRSVLQCAVRAPEHQPGQQQQTAVASSTPDPQPEVRPNTFGAGVLRMHFACQRT